MLDGNVVRTRTCQIQAQAISEAHLGSTIEMQSIILRPLRGIERYSIARRRWLGQQSADQQTRERDDVEFFHRASQHRSKHQNGKQITKHNLT